MTTLALAAVEDAAARIASRVHVTPLLSNRSISERTGSAVRLKCENLQRAGAFKIRGALNALLLLREEDRSRGVVAFSSGNHAQGVALAARMLGIPATIIMPERAVAAKVEATRAYGAAVVQSGVNEKNRHEVAARIAAESGAIIIPPFDHDDIIAGAGTVGLEILSQWPEVEAIVVPLGGGGLLSGVALAATSINPKVRVYGVEPAAGDDGRQSFRAGSIVRIDPPATIADGARTLSLGERTFAIIRERVTDIVTVGDDELLAELRYTMSRTKLVIEPTGCLAVAALLQRSLDLAGQKVVAVISGGNLDFDLLSER
ncbi:MAG TPA: threonine/serine dehydratase [Thermoanaerobaculia bacterium]|nr:threonine/serine dehydratase [Thermoanaerobaculia bacterium]